MAGRDHASDQDKIKHYPPRQGLGVHEVRLALEERTCVSHKMPKGLGGDIRLGSIAGYCATEQPDSQLDMVSKSERRPEQVIGKRKVRKDFTKLLNPVPISAQETWDKLGTRIH
jgi:hypothetical protein